MASVDAVGGPAVIGGDPEKAYRSRSLWLDQLDGSLAPRPSLPGDRDCDVAIVGAGFTGLWTAYYLATLQPDLRVVVIEREIAGFGPSGRNGGWAIGGLPGSRSAYRLRDDPDRAARALRATYDAIDEIATVTQREQIDCGFVKAGALTIATSAPQWRRLQTRETNAATASHEEADGRLLSVPETEALVRVPDLHGGRYTPHAARIDPARLVRALAVACERRGVTIYERTAASSLEPGQVRCGALSVRAEAVIRATESYTTQMPGHGRRFLPLYSLMIATAPLEEDVWAQLGWRDGLLVEDRHFLFFYAQRTTDGRIAIGGRGAPYRLTSPIDDRNERDTRARSPGRHAPAHVPHRRLRGGHTPLGWATRRAARLEHERQLRSGDRAWGRRRLHRARGRGGEHLGRNARRSRVAPRFGPRHDAVGRSSEPAVGARAAALSGLGSDRAHARRGRPSRGCQRPAGAAYRSAQTVPAARLSRPDRLWRYFLAASKNGLVPEAWSVTSTTARISGTAWVIATSMPCVRVTEAIPQPWQPPPSRR